VLVKFHSPAFATITMFGDVAVTLLKMMGMSGSVPGALRPEDVPAALERLKKSLGSQPPTQLPEKDKEEDKDSPPVSLSQRAFPLIELLTAAAKKNVHVMWD